MDQVYDEKLEPANTGTTADLRSNWVLRVLDGVHRDAEVAIGSREVLLVGQAEECDVVLRDPGIAEHHVSISFVGRQITLRALAEGVRVNRRIVDVGDAVDVPLFTLVRLGPVTVALGEAGSAQWGDLDSKAAADEATRSEPSLGAGGEAVEGAEAPIYADDGPGVDGFAADPGASRDRFPTTIALAAGAVIAVACIAWTFTGGGDGFTFRVADPSRIVAPARAESIDKPLVAPFAQIDRAPAALPAAREAAVPAAAAAPAAAAGKAATHTGGFAGTTPPVSTAAPAGDDSASSGDKPKEAATPVATGADGLEVDVLPSGEVVITRVDPRSRSAGQDRNVPAAAPSAPAPRAGTTSSTPARAATPVAPAKPGVQGEASTMRPPMAKANGAVLLQAVREVFRVNGLSAAQVRQDSESTVMVEGIGTGDKRLEAVIAHALEDVPGLSAVHVKPLPEPVVAVAPTPAPVAPAPQDDPPPAQVSAEDQAAKRIAAVVDDSPAYVVTADGSRYFIGATLPQGFRIAAIHGSEVTVLRENGQRMVMSF